MLSFSRMEEQAEHQQWPQLLSPCTSRRRRSNDSSSPEFEFWMVRNPSCPQPDLHSADELFSHGILLPLHQLHHQQPPTATYQTNSPPPPPPTKTTIAMTTCSQEEEKEAEPPPGADQPQPGPDAATDLSNLSAASAFSSSKRWKDMIFKRSDRKSSRNGEGVDDNDKEKDKVKKKEKKKKMSAANITGGVGNSGVAAAELNIHIWPFRRSRSAGNGGSRPRMAATASASRKVSSAPCSRSNSAGESKSRKWPSSPSRGGVHLGRSSPVWQVRRGSGGGGTAAAGGRSSEAALKRAEKGVQKEGNESIRKNAVQGGVATGGGSGNGPRARVLNLNVPMCIGYRHQLSCRSDENSAISVAASAAAGAGGGEGGGGGQSGGAASGEGVRGSNLFNIRGLFTKKVH